ncbi:MAG: MBL fold metallo-hydrolase [Bacteroidetes bacterium]|nr:MBL fold metallo-hydrolase [Bacteroidota bacterium]
MKITFHGAARTVTGSKHMVTLNNGKKLLLDCGFFQGHGSDTDEMNRNFNFDPSEIDCMILSHAHIDHSGNIPNLVKQGFKGNIYCTPATRDLCVIMLADTAHIQENDLKYINRAREAKGRELIEPIYTMKDVDEAMNHFVTVPYRKNFKINGDIQFMLTDSGHILGAGGVNLTIRENDKTFRIFFSGDIGRKIDKILKAPEPFPQADYILCESTYGNRLHESQEQTESQLLKVIMETCVENKGKIIIPAFSLGRTQEIVYALNNLKNANKLPLINVYVDSPLSINATGIMRMHPECFNDDMLHALRTDKDPFGFDHLYYVQNAQDSIKLNDLKGPCIIISASGMAEAGRIKHHIKNNIGNPANTILMVGYCTPGSLGGRLAAGNKEVSIFGKEYQVKARVEVMNSYSAHADYNEMLEYLSCQNKNEVKKVFLVHGEYDVQVEWREKLMKAGFGEIEIPEMKSEWELE